MIIDNSSTKPERRLAFKFLQDKKIHKLQIKTLKIRRRSGRLRQITCILHQRFKMISRNRG